jgi:hypothetical protein
MTRTVRGRRYILRIRVESVPDVKPDRKCRVFKLAKGDVFENILEGKIREQNQKERIDKCEHN